MTPITIEVNYSDGTNRDRMTFEAPGVEDAINVARRLNKLDGVTGVYVWWETRWRDITSFGTFSAKHWAASVTTKPWAA